MELGESLGLSAPELSSLYYALLLKDAGCSANAAPVSEAFASDDHAVKRALKTTDSTNLIATVGYVARNVGLGESLLTKARAFGRVVGGRERMARNFTRIRCERGADIARQLGFDAPTADAIRALDEHWDGGGYPDGLAGDAIPLPARIACLAQTTEVFLTEYGLAEALAIVRQRRGSWFDPRIADVLLAWSQRHDWWAEVKRVRHAAQVEHYEPRGQALTVDEDGLDRIADAFAEVIDAKSPFTSSHSRGVARIARRLGESMGEGAHACRLLYRAGLLHDIGKLGVSNRILDKPGKLTDAEFAEIKKHPRYSREILDPVDAFRDVLAPACYHHERLDGSGYPWGLAAPELDLTCRIMAVADVCEALTADRPYREGLALDVVQEIMMRDAGHALDGAVLDALFGSGSSASALVGGSLDRPTRWVQPIDPLPASS